MGAGSVAGRRDAKPLFGSSRKGLRGAARAGEKELSRLPMCMLKTDEDE